MKKNLLVMVSLLLVFCMLPVASFAADIQTVRITHHRTVNVRSGPGKGYKVLGEVKPGETFPYLGTENGWHCIQYTSTRKGYVSGNLSTVETTVSPNTAQETEPDDESMVHITHHRAVNVRRGPGKEYGVICEVRPGASYPYLGTAYGWHCIKLGDGSTGYVANNLTTVEGKEWRIDVKISADSNESLSENGSSSSGTIQSNHTSSASSLFGPTKKPTRTKDCSRCHGDGKVDCSRCNGHRGKYVYGSVPNYSGKSKTTYRTWEDCSKCRGSGKQDCSTCGGDGKVEY